MADNALHVVAFVVGISHIVGDVFESELLIYGQSPRSHEELAVPMHFIIFLEMEPSMIPGNPK